MPEPKTRFDRCKSYARIFLTHLISQVGLCLLVIAYALVGAVIFKAIESREEVRQRHQVSQLRRQCLREMWAITESLNVFYDEEWIDRVGVKLKEFEDKVVHAVRSDGYDGKDVSEASLQWSFSGALLYSITVITTIGYGNIAPKTSSGKVVTIVYALFGIPLMLLCLTNIGNILAHSFKFFYSRVCCALCHRQRESLVTGPKTQIPAEVLETVVSVANSVAGGRDHREVKEAPEQTSEKGSPNSVLDKASLETTKMPLTPTPSTVGPPPPKPIGKEEDRIPVYLVLLLVSGYICFGATLFSVWENWTFLDGAYFSFITLSTIGFGDFVPGSAIFETDTSSGDGQAKLIICCFYLVLGLAIIAMSFNLVQEEVVLKCKDLVRNLKSLVTTVGEEST
ncbi:two pore potassium channel protein sup-9-like [Ornithodoros turicata]